MLLAGILARHSWRQCQWRGVSIMSSSGVYHSLAGAGTGVVVSSSSILSLTGFFKLSRSISSCISTGAHVSMGSSTTTALLCASARTTRDLAHQQTQNNMEAMSTVSATVSTPRLCSTHTGFAAGKGVGGLANTSSYAPFALSALTHVRSAGAGGMNLQQTRSYARRVPAQGYYRLTTKRVNRHYYRGTGSRNLGRINSRGTFKRDKMKEPEYIFPNLSGFELKPYVEVLARPKREPTNKIPESNQ